MTYTLILTNKAGVEIHRDGCGDIAKQERKGGIVEAEGVEATSTDEALESVYDFVPEHKVMACAK